LETGKGSWLAQEAAGFPSPGWSFSDRAEKEQIVVNARIDYFVRRAFLPDRNFQVSAPEERREDCGE
jgi:hypothetical protein